VCDIDISKLFFRTGLEPYDIPILSFHCDVAARASWTSGDRQIFLVPPKQQKFRSNRQEQSVVKNVLREKLFIESMTI